MSLSMADRDGFIWLDGKLVPWRDSRVHVLTHALHYGSAVFEGERIYDGCIFRLDENGGNYAVLKYFSFSTNGANSGS